MVTGRQILENSAQKRRDSMDAEFDYIEPARYDLAQKKLSFKAMVVGSRGDRYKVEVAFFDVDPMGLTPDQLAAGLVPKPADLLDHRVKVDCTCNDYAFNGAYVGNLANDCALYTHKDMDTYEKKTDAAPKNPEHLPFGCKHITSFLHNIEAAVNS